MSFISSLLGLARNRRGGSEVRPSSAAGFEALEPRTLLTTGVHIPVIDLMVGYTTAAKNYAGGDVKINNKILRAVADLNQTLVNSKINETVRLVKTVEVTGYTETKNSKTDLTNLESGTSLASLRTMRDTVGADLVSLWVSDAGSLGGTAGKPSNPSATVNESGSGFSVVSLKVSFPVSFIHEIGHNLGAGHDRINQPTDGPTDKGIPYARDYIATIDGNKYGTAMAGWNIPFFSNPNITFRGAAIGVADTSTSSADNAKAMNLLASKIAAYKPTVTANTTGPLAGLGTVENVHGTKTINFQVIYYDDSAVNVASLDSQDILVTGPGIAAAGALATFHGISSKVGGGVSAVTATTHNASAVIANYSILTTSVGTLDKYAFSLKAQQVSDQTGTFATGGALLVASGNPLGGVVKPVLPEFAGPSIGRDFDLGDLTGKSFRISDFTGPYFRQRANGTDALDYEIYRFKATKAFTLTLKSTGANAPEIFVGQGAATIYPAADGITYKVAAGGTFTIEVGPGGANYDTPAEFTIVGSVA